MWAKSLEEEIRNRVSYILPLHAYILPNQEHKTNVLFHWQSRTVKLRHQVTQPVLTFKGGIIANEMGLGKTLTVIALVITSRLEKNMLRKVPGTHGCSNSLDASILPVPEKEVKVVEKNGRVQSRATLVACPSHLAKQWESEVRKHVREEMRVSIKVITSIAEHRACNVLDFVNADFIIISVQLLQNPNYNKLLGVKAQRSVSGRIEGCERKARSYLRNGKGRTRSPVIGAFFFERVIVDEGHGLFSGKQADMKVSIIDNLSYIQCSYRWYLSGTPFTDQLLTPRGALRFIGRNSSDAPRKAL